MKDLVGRGTTEETSARRNKRRGAFVQNVPSAEHALAPLSSISTEFVEKLVIQQKELENNNGPL
jgi:hypothetical protein